MILCDYMTVREREQDKSEILSKEISLRLFDDLEELVSSVSLILKTIDVEINNEWNEKDMSTIFLSVKDDVYKIRFYRCKDLDDCSKVMILDVRCVKG